MEETILILDFGSQYTQLIARRIRELNVYCDIYPYNEIPDLGPHIKGVILSGSPFSVRDENPLVPDLSKIQGIYPILGVCYGAQHMALAAGGDILPSEIREYGRANLSFIDSESELMKGMSNGSQVWMSHGDTILNLPENFSRITSTANVDVAGFKINHEKTFGIQFHPEVYHTLEGATLLRNYIVDICGCDQSWTSESFIESTVEQLRKKLRDDQVVLGLSGGVDSSVAGMLLHQAIGKNLHCIFVDNGLLRKDEFQQVLASYQHMHLNITGVDSSERFLSELKGVTDPEKKRKIIGRVFIEVFEEEANKISNIKWLAQGTIYPDVIESKSVKGPSATIKSHHNVGGLPEHLNLKIVEPLNTLFKDEVRRVGGSLGLDPLILSRHPFPGPGLAVRILGDITHEKVRLLQEADHIFIDGLRKFNLYDETWQAFVVLLPIQAVGVMGDERTYESVVALRAVNSTDGMTADWTHLPSEFLAWVSSEISNKVAGINRVVYDISSKPPATIEWE